MNFEEEFKKLKSYYKTDALKFKEQHDLMCSNFDVEMVTSNVKTFLQESIKELDNRLANITIKMQLGDNVEFIPLAYIARTYFNKSRAWLYQRINGHVVNGRASKFTAEEVETFNRALQDISKQIGSINITFNFT
jgi:hypothetical protein